MSIQPVLLIALLFLVILLIFLTRRKKQANYMIVEDRSLLKFHNNHPTSSFSSENEIKDPREKYKANPTKCFSCEKEWGYKGQPSKCFSCEEPMYSLTKLN